MIDITHAYFGELQFQELVDVCWESKLRVQDAEIDVWLWAKKPGAEVTLLDDLAECCKNLDELNAKARIALVEEITTNTGYIDFHFENIEYLPDLKELADIEDKTEQIKRFVATMKLERIGLWTTPDSSPVVMDYMIDRERSDQILAVKLDAKGNVQSVDWES